jgi:hypothetical protein
MNPSPCRVRFRFIEKGAHTHVRVFAGFGVGSLGNCGNLVFRNEEWQAFAAALVYIRNSILLIEIVPED